MPRLAPSLLKRACRLNPLLPRLLRECRYLDSARNELRWMREHAVSLVNSARGDGNESNVRLRRMVYERSRGKPLQYILGDQPFGNLEILCRNGVLIPRHETEAYTTRTARWILSYYRNRANDGTSNDRGMALGSEDVKLDERPLRILDLCTGTGCIPLLLHSLLAPSFPKLQIVGVDISTRAVDLACENLIHNIAMGELSPRAADEVHFVQADVLKEPEPEPGVKTTPSSTGTGLSDLSAVLPKFVPDGKWDVLMCNPPYISPMSYSNGTTRRSVRMYEPKLALVPPPVTSTPPSAYQSEHLDGLKELSAPLDPSSHIREDSFYPRLLDIAIRHKTELTVMECGDREQAVRVRSLVGRLGRLNDGQLGDEGYSSSGWMWKCEQPEDDIHKPLPRLDQLNEEDWDGVAFDKWEGCLAVAMNRMRLQRLKE